ncbi:undecaprenyl-phosphate glucose phosphotransferase [Pseudomonas sp. UBA2684]|uniref:undecaprenyl-phosphate glucose phosphotransferase n=1 Tax=Pseudomonas sp. UBA2684 TaxID=1947311 RepID=UPI000E9A9015|nr:undecaprenyl-phosphate glucose phosphotransferase [Pseudomonas sp. UBA2684]HBX57835.1 undecaprenyl-phosphate glucose phosphotransferase [Pseudomonas sp.]|tara:strand:+ start:9566 stop:10999 length:1434 start_codon:yes stop_codon:yes gene_type:complete
MRQLSVGNSLLARPGFVEYFVAVMRIVHGFTAALPGLLLLLWLSDEPGLTQSYSAVLLFFGVLTVMMFQALGVYSEEIFSNLLRFRMMFFAWSAAFCLLLFMHQALAMFSFMEWRYLTLWFVASLVAFGGERLFLLALFRYWMRSGQFLQSAVILGGTENGVRLAEFISRNGDIRSGLIGFIDDRIGRMPDTLADLPLLGNSGDLERLIRKERVTQVLVALPWSAENRIGQIVLELRKLPVNVLLVPDMLAFRHARNRITEVGGLPMFNVSERPLDGWSPLIKRIEDLLLATLALLPALPVMLLVALAIKLDSPGPVLFRQKRYGYNNRLIEVFKFRSMYCHQSDANAERQTTRDDDRITPVGRFIRKTSLDELPQLFNVLLGSMSMVGPRPHATATKAAGILFEDAVKEYTARHRVKPGITGWAQVNGFRGETNTLEKIEKRVEYDLQYIENWSVWFDLYVLFRTIPAVLLTREAY